MKAFPRADGRHDSSKPDEQGMDLRDYFAGLAMAYWLSLPISSEQLSMAASEAYKVADAMMKEREKTGE
jgi:hypothetical protein